MRLIRLLCVLSLVLLCTSASSQEYQPGLDVSHWQGAINWTAVKNADIKFVFAKATEGVDFVDVRFHTNMSGAMAAGVPIGPYHFARLNSGENIPTDAVDEANDFVDAIEQYYSSSAMVMRPVIDFEQVPNDPVSPDMKTYISKWLRDFSGVVETRLGVKPIIYTCCGLTTSTVLEADIAEHDLWVVKLLSGSTFDPNNPPTASQLGIWSDWKFWQWSHTGNVAGLNPVDRDVFKGTLEELAQHIVTYRGGDFDRSGTVDAADYVQWRQTFGNTINFGTAADGNLSGVVDADDLRILKANFGKTYGTSGSALSAAVPEPGATTLFLTAVGAVALRRRRLHATRIPKGALGFQSRVV